MADPDESRADEGAFRDEAARRILAGARAEAAEEIPRRQMALRACLRKLESRPRHVLELRYVRDLPSDAIARRLGTTAEDARTLLFRIRRSLAACVDEGLGVAGPAPAADGAAGDGIGALADRQVDGGLPSDEEARLVDWIKADPANARAFARQAVLHEQLRVAMRYEATGGAPFEAEIAARARARRLQHLVVGLSSLLLIAITIAALAIFGGRDPGAPPAMLAAANDARWENADVERMLRGGGLPEGLFRLRRGIAEFRVGGGATVAVEGPADLEIPDPLRLRIRRGRFRVDSPSRQSRFVVETPGVTLAGVGADFGVTAGPGLKVFASVIRGAVVVTVEGEPTFLEAGQGVRVGDGRHPRLVAPRPAEFAALRFPGPSSFEGARLSPDRLVDPGFESGFGSEDEATGAEGPAWRGTTGHVDIVGDAGRDGSRAVRIRARGSRAWPQVRQEVATGPLAGQLVVASVRARQPSGDLLRERQCAVLRVVFRDASGGEIAAAERRFLWADDPVDCYIPGRLVVRAPAEAVAVDFQVMLNAAGLETGAILVDDARLSLARQGSR